MSNLAFLSAHNFIHAAGWTIIHSLWQITLIALILRVVMLMMKNSSASGRYNMSIAGLAIVLMLSVSTFSKEYSNTSAELINSENSQLNIEESTLSDNYEMNPESTFIVSFKHNLKIFFEKNLSIIVIVWNICVLILLIKLFGGLIYSQRMKRNQTSFLPEFVHKKLNDLAEVIGVKKCIQILESAIVKVPVVIGYFKPVILLPAGIMTGLTNDQIEAIIAHELAHIKRNDFLINIFQTIIEILFFYHPAIWYISKTIRNERESACDDMAAVNDTSRISLAKALTNIEIINHKKIELTMAFTRHKHTLLYRLKRIVNPQKQGFTFREGMITGLIIVAGLIIMSFSAKLILNSGEALNSGINTNEHVTTADMQLLGTKETLKLKTSAILNKPINFNKDNKIITNDLRIIDDTIVKKIQETRIEYSINGKLYDLEFDKNKNVTGFTVNNKKIPKSDWKTYDKEIKTGFYLKEKFDREMEAHEKEMVKHEKVMKEYEKQMQLHGEEMKKHEKEMVEFEEQMKKKRPELEKHEKMMAEFEKQMELKEIDVQKLEKQMIEFEKQMQLKKKELNMQNHEQQIAQFEKQMQKQEIQFKKQMELHEIEMQKHEKQMIEFEKQMELQEKEMKKHEAKMKLHEEKFSIIEDLIEEMKTDKLIEKEAKSFKVRFTDTELLINGKKQSDKVFKKYKTMFESKSKGKFDIEGDYNFNTK